MKKFFGWLGLNENVTSLVWQLQSELEDIFDDSGVEDQKDRARELYNQRRRELDKLWVGQEISEKEYRSAEQHMDQVARSFGLSTAPVQKNRYW